VDALGLGEAFRAMTIRGNAVSLRDFRIGHEVLRLDLTRLPQDQRYSFVHRADMIALLAQAAQDAGVEILLNREVTGFVGAKVTCADGSVETADLIIGADGLHSVMRPLLNGTSAPFFTGQVAWRALVPNTDGHPVEAQVHMGPGRHVVTYPLRDGALLNIVAVQERGEWAAEGWHHGDDAANLRAAFSDFGGPLADQLARVKDPGLWGLFRHPVARIWHDDRHAILGDAAHPTLPFLAQGANMALEDAWALAACLDVMSQSEGLRAWQARRQPRVTRVIEAANGNARKYHLRNPLVRGVAHLGLGLLGRAAPTAMLRQFDWLYGYDVTRDAPQ
jgi:salicylate hydroxylase